MCWDDIEIAERGRWWEIPAYGCIEISRFVNRNCACLLPAILIYHYVMTGMYSSDDVSLFGPRK
jgi:hypothetical protein